MKVELNQQQFKSLDELTISFPTWKKSAPFLREKFNIVYYPPYSSETEFGIIEGTDKNITMMLLRL